jgi:hypothetical protein
MPTSRLTCALEADHPGPCETTGPSAATSHLSGSEWSWRVGPSSAVDRSADVDLADLLERQLETHGSEVGKTLQLAIRIAINRLRQPS